ncbi:MAG: prepilin peptidase [Acidobacteria bacterium]|nr:prepilin peptidase [Acidobacteriota bacterium]
MGSGTAGLVGVVAPLGLALIASCVDIRTRRIPNYLTLSGLLAGLGVQLAAGGVGGVAWSAAGMLVGFALFMPPFLLGGMGAGDVKLLAALGAWLGPSLIVWTALYAALAGGVLAVIVAVSRGYLGRAVKNLGVLLSTWRQAGIKPVEPMTLATSGGPRLPYSLPIAAGLMATLWFR